MIYRRKYVERRSGLEDDIEADLKKKKIKYKYEPKEGKLSYTVPASVHSYTPDFYITTKSGKEIIIEAKGIWDREDRKKHVLIKQQYPDLDIRFIFSYSKKKIGKTSKTTYADICEGRGRGPLKGLTWPYATKVIPSSWLKE